MTKRKRRWSAAVLALALAAALLPLPAALAEEPLPEAVDLRDQAAPAGSQDPFGGVLQEAPAVKRAVLNGKTVTVSVCSGEGSAMVICGAYSKDEQLLESRTHTFQGSQEFSFQFEAKKIDHVKVFLLDGSGAPLCPRVLAEPDGGGDILLPEVP